MWKYEDQGDIEEIGIRVLSLVNLAHMLVTLQPPKIAVYCGRAERKEELRADLKTLLHGDMVSLHRTKLLACGWTPPASRVPRLGPSRAAKGVALVRLAGDAAARFYQARKNTAERAGRKEALRAAS